MNYVREPLCAVCEKKLFDGRPVHSVRNTHWDCLPEELKNPKVPSITELRELVKRGDEAIERLRAAIRKL